MNPSNLRKQAHKVGVPIQKLSARIMTKLKDAPQAQKRTSKHKKAVKIVKDFVFKGPYACDEKQLIKNLRYTCAIELLEAALQLDEWQRGSLRWEYLGCWYNYQYYLVAPNVGKWRDITFKLENTKIETDVKVPQRGEAISRVSDIEGTGLLIDYIKSATLQHLYLRFLLDIGDSGTHNILIREDHNSTGRLIAGIDLEETRIIKPKERRLDHLFKKAPSKRQVCLYAPDVGNIKTLSYGQLDQRTLDKLSAIGVNLQRFKQNIDQW